MSSLVWRFFNRLRYWAVTRQSVLAGSKLGRAIEYSLKYEETFKTILKDGHLVLSNNLAERAIKSLVMGRSKRVQWTLLA
ncbi:transposase [Streptococcus pneumoniae]|nr:transposase [Streptococcus pneumoniae]